ncbi:hypothetical protein TNCT_131211 [Trichonephila clavata]|uniref:Uncharacterized protein n=1 Tax=Trichonephila clavata TaxID=2740835 RepID=A0A8X6FNZ5_TRICU|nr:hypothetical protein TNCT_131211 [Trichonephila clavata]
MLTFMIDASDNAISGVLQKLKLCFFGDYDSSKPTLEDKSPATSTSPSTVSPHHSQQGTSGQSSKLRVRFAESPAQYVTRSGRAVHPSK